MTEPRETILVVDDERLNINVLMELLSSDYDIMIAKNGKEAMKRVTANRPPDLILLDVMMPEMDGYQVIQQLKETPATAHIPVIFVSALSAVGDESRGLTLGAVDYITKPISPELVKLRVATHLRLKRQREALVAEIAVRKQAEEGLLLAHKVIATTHEGIVITDANGIIVEVNPAYEEIMGYTRAEVMGRKANVSKSGRHDAAFYQEMWRHLIEKGSWVGEIWDRRKSGEVFPKLLSINAIPDSQGRVSHYVGLFMDITHQKASEEHLEKLAFYDPLTHLPNRALFRDRLTHELAACRRHGQPLGMFFIDLDRFKYVNDTLGHDVGDDLLIEVAARLRGTVRQNDTVCRLGGDEFTVILPEVGSPHEAGRIAEKIIRELTRVFPLRGHEVFIGGSVGITIAPDDGHEFDILTKHADVAMYAAKEAGRGVYRFFTPDMNARNANRLALEADLRRALENGQITVFYQPKLNLADQRILGMEALARWEHPDKGMISPVDFIPLAEETGLIIPLGERVLAMACGQLQAWRKAGLDDLRVSVNLSAKQIQDPRLLDKVMGILEETGLSPDGLELEITESVAMTNVEASIGVMTSMKNRGLHLSIDDFGTGYSSLSYLKKFPIDTLKIDQSFVRNLTLDSDDDAIVHAIISLANALNVTVIAEGVETAEQMMFLQDKACEQIQGYFLSRPVAANQFETFVRKHRGG